MFKKLFFLVLLFLSIISCDKKIKKEEIKEDINQIEKEEIKPKEDYLVFQNELTQKNIDSALYVNVEFTTDGVKFKKNKPSYIQIPNINLNLKEDFNISFWFKFQGIEGKIPKALLSYRGNSPSSNSPIFIYLPARKLSGSFGNQILWAENYDMKQGNSKKYYDSFQLMPDTFYHASINYVNNKLQFYVESELYAEFPNVNPHEMIGTDFFLGSLPLGGEFKYPLDGTMKRLQVFSRSLSEKEIVDIYNVD